MIKISLWCILTVFFFFHCSATLADPLPGNDFSEYVLAVLQRYPTDGTHGYYWPQGSSWAGNTRDLYYQGRLWAAGDSLGRCYCCGLTFEVFFLAYEQYCKDQGWEFVIGDFDAQGLAHFRGRWFGSDGNRKTLQNALEQSGLGRAIPLAQAQRGDFLQFWRHHGSGHSVIFLSWIYDANRQIIGFEYWSTQSATQGIGYQSEYFGSASGVDLQQFYLARVGNNEHGQDGSSQ